MNAARRLLLPLSGLYGAAIYARNAYYDRVSGAVRQAGVPVISVGNITVGGTGKTPFVIHVVERLVALGRRPAILTRGYKGSAAVLADEVVEFHESLPQTPVVVNPDRVVGSARACAEHGADCLVLDDGFQHRRLARDLDIVLIDALDPWGGNMLLPAGRLREPLGGLRRADVLVLTRVNQVSRAEAEALAGDLRARFGKPVLMSYVESVALVAREGARTAAATLAGRSVLPVCGLGNPRTFVDLVHTLTRAVAPPVLFGDHAVYGPQRVRAILEAARRSGAEWVVTTRKDWVKLHGLWPDTAVPLVRLDIALSMKMGTADLDDHLQRALEKRT
jgi:tetraacyldisaccharide 4'-kinase